MLGSLVSWVLFGPLAVLVPLGFPLASLGSAPLGSLVPLGPLCPSALRFLGVPLAHPLGCLGPWGSLGSPPLALGGEPKGARGQGSQEDGPRGPQGTEGHKGPRGTREPKGAKRTQGNQGTQGRGTREPGNSSSGTHLPLGWFLGSLVPLPWVAWFPVFSLVPWLPWFPWVPLASLGSAPLGSLGSLVPIGPLCPSVPWGPLGLSQNLQNEANAWGSEIAPTKGSLGLQP